MVHRVSGINYRLDAASSKNLDAYLTALGVAPRARELAAAAVPTHVITLDGDVYTLKTLSDIKDVSVSFKLGAPFDYETADGRKVKSVFTRDGNKLVEVQTGDKTNTIIREFSTSEIKMTMTVDGVTATRTYKAQ